MGPDPNEMCYLGPCVGRGVWPTRGKECTAVGVEAGLSQDCGGLSAPCIFTTNTIYLLVL